MESRCADARLLSCALPRPSRPGAAASWRRAGAQGSAGGPAPRRPGLRATPGRPRRPSPSRFPPSLPHFARMHYADPCPAARPLRPLHNALAGPRMRRDERHARRRRACAHSPRPGQPPQPCRLRHARAPSAPRRARADRGPAGPPRPLPAAAMRRPARAPRPRRPACSRPPGPACPAKRGRRFAAKEAIAWRAAAGGGSPQNRPRANRPAAPCGAGRSGSGANLNAYIISKFRRRRETRSRVAARYAAPPCGRECRCRLAR